MKREPSSLLSIVFALSLSPSAGAQPSAAARLGAPGLLSLPRLNAFPGLPPDPAGNREGAGDTEREFRVVLRDFQRLDLAYQNSRDDSPAQSSADQRR